MIAGKRHIRSGDEFNHLFPTTQGEFITVNKYAFLNDTLDLMERVFHSTLDDTKKATLYFKSLKPKNEYEMCRNIWRFCFSHLQYTRDEEGKEQVRRPARTWRDRKAGVDCDCMSVFIGSILMNLGIPFSLRLTKNGGDEFEHVYPVAHTQNGLIKMDAVINRFNEEAPHTEKKDIRIMELQYLNGVDNRHLFSVETDDNFEFDALIDNDYPIDAQSLLLDETDLEGFRDRFRNFKKKVSNVTKKINTKNIKDTLKKGLHIVNKINPAVALLRLGVLASMKLNVMQVASKLRFAYWSDQTAKRNQIHPAKFTALKRIREKLEKIFFNAGGKAENLRKAVLEGKGNRDRRVTLNGLGEVIFPISDEDSLRSILGDELYHGGLYEEEGINGLGEVATATAIAAASAVIGTISALIKKLGALFPKGSPQDEQEQVQENTEKEEEKTRKFSVKNLLKRFKNNRDNRPQTPTPNQPKVTEPIPYNTPESAQSPQSPPDTSDYTEPFIPPETKNFFLPPETGDSKEAEDKKKKEDDPKDEKGFIPWVKANPLLSAGIGIGTIGVGYLIYRGYKTARTVKAVTYSGKSSNKKGLSGASTTKKASAKLKKGTQKRKSQTVKKAPIQKVALL